MGLPGVLLLLLMIVSCTDWAASKRSPSIPKPPPPGLRLMPSEEAAEQPKYAVGKGHRTRSGSFSAPAVFDARTKWPNCSSIRTVRNQGQCCTCWAVAAASVLSDRICISRGQNDFISANQAAGCTDDSRIGKNTCIGGGDPTAVYKKASLHGLSSGGEYGSHAGCVPYPVNPYSAVPSPIICATACTNAWPQNLTFDSTTRIVDSYWINYYANMSVQANIDSNVNKMQEDLFSYGSITASIQVYDDFQYWKPINGTYVPGPKAKAGGLHSVRILGWNQTNPLDRYWLVANSWGTYRGDNGIWRVKMGNNIIGIESYISAPIVDASAQISCDTASFCKAPIDQGVKFQYNVSSSPAYLFQGDCKLEVVINPATQKITAKGSAQPVGRQFLNVPTPVRAQTVYNGLLYLIDAAGRGGLGCTVAPGTTKYICYGGYWGLTAGPFAIKSTGDTYLYWKDTSPTWMLQGNQTLITSGGIWINDLFTKNTNLTLVTAFLNIDDTQMFVFGKGATGNPLTGVMKYPDSKGGFAWKALPAAPANLQSC